MTRKSRAAHLLLFILAVIVSLVCGELLLALLGFEPYIRRTESLFSERLDAGSFDEMIAKGILKGPLGLLKPDADLGYTLYREPHGFPDPKNFYDDWSGYTRILVLGDSFVVGAIVPRDQTFMHLLGEHYREQEVLFFDTGTKGYGQGNQLGVLKRYCDVIKPQMVLLCFYTGNDFLDNLTPLDRYTAFSDKFHVANYEVVITGDELNVRRRGTDELFLLYQQYMCVEPRDYASFKQYMKYAVFSRSRLGSLAWLSLQVLKSKALKLPRQGGNRKIRDRHEHPQDIIYRTTRDYLARIQAYLSERGILLYVFIIPDIGETTDVLTQSPDYLRARALLKELSIPYIDSYDHLTGGNYRNPGIRSGDNHWNASGHLKAYAILKQHIDTFLETLKAE